MAQFLMAKFLSQALEWKVRFPTAQFYAGLRYEPFVYEKARLAFPEYSKLYPDNKQFTEKFVKDLRNRDRELLKIINPEVVTAEYEVQDRRFETEALLEQQQVTKTSPQEITQPFSLSQPPTPHLPSMPSAGAIPTTSEAPGKVEEEPSTVVSKAEQTKADTGEIKRPSLQIPKVSSSFVNTVKNFTSASSRLFQRGIGRYLTLERAVTGFTTVLGGIIGSSLGPIGTLAGAGAGFLTPSFIKSGGGRFLSGFGNGVITFGERISNQASRLPVPNPSKKVLLGLLVGFFLLVFGVGFLPVSPTSQQPTTGTTVPLVGSITNCQFTRGNRTPPQESYQSPILLSYFQEASQISSVPAVILAAIARVESPTITAKKDADLPKLSSTAGCPRSSTGALGIMQLQPPGTTGYIKDAIEKGASYLGKTAEELSEADFCDLKSNIIVASGFILKKLQLSYGIGDGNKWDPSWTNNKEVIYKLAEGYYGCLEYGGPDPLKCGGPYNYGNDLWASIQNCQLSSAPAYTPGAGSGILSCPLNGTVAITNGSKDVGGHCSPSYEKTYGVCTKLGSTGYTGRDTAIDVTSSDRFVYLPRVSGVDQVKWTVDEASNVTITVGEGGGMSVAAKTTAGGKTYRIRFVHLESTSLKIGDLVDPGTLVGQYYLNNPYGAHVHITLQEDGVFKPVDLYFNLCK